MSQNPYGLKIHIPRFSDILYFNDSINVHSKENNFELIEIFL
jgi:hypothetical protein